jgi:hypothetical protein
MISKHFSWVLSLILLGGVSFQAASWADTNNSRPKVAVTLDEGSVKNLQAEALIDAPPSKCPSRLRALHCAAIGMQREDG